MSSKSYDIKDAYSLLSAFTPQNSSTVIRAVLLILGCSFVAALLYINNAIKPPHKRRRQPNGKRYVMPPEPPGAAPIFGHLVSLRDNLMTSLKEWPKVTGEFTTVTFGSTTWVLLNSSRVTHEIMTKKGSITNDRPHLPVAQGLISLNMRTVHMQISDSYKEQRRVYHQLLTGSSIYKYGLSQELESTQMLAEHLISPEKWYLNHARYANSVINLIAYGKRTLSMTPLAKAVLEVITLFFQNNPPANIVDMMPVLANIPKPLQWWRKKAMAIGARTYEVYSAQWQSVAKAVKDGTAPPSFSRDVLQEEAGKFQGTEDQAMFLAAQLVEAGSDTTRGALNIVAMVMIAAPDFVAKAREELDRVCGANAERLPMFKDEDELKYICAAVKETLRWHPLFPFTLPHRLEKDLEFEGYVFPADTNFVINDTFIASDPGHYKDPEKFLPERWMDGHENDILKGMWAFGGGRRVCVGYRLAQRSIFINLARLIYCFDFEPAGHINADFSFNNFTHDEPFPARPKVRSLQHAKLIESEARRLDVWDFANGKLPPLDEEKIGPPSKYMK